MAWSFLPTDYESPKGNSNYLKLQDGDTKFRILSDAITGWIDRADKKPIRTKDKPEMSYDPTRPAKHFRAFTVWDFEAKAIKILEITQKAIQNGIMWYYQDPDFGDPKDYPIKITKTGKDLETKYQVKALWKEPLSPEITQARMDTPVNLEKLFDGADPFTK